MCYVINHQEPNYLDLTKERLLDLGYSKDLIRNLIEELIKQSFNVQATFYHKLNGFTLDEIAEMLNVHKSTVCREYIQKKLQNVKEILQKCATNL